MLGLTPTRAVAKDEEIPVGRKGKTTRRQRTGIGLLDSEHSAESTSLERDLIHLLDAVEPAAEALEALRGEHDSRADFFCSWLSATATEARRLTYDPRAHRSADAPSGIDFYGPFDDSD